MCLGCLLPDSLLISWPPYQAVALDSAITVAMVLAGTGLTSTYMYYTVAQESAIAVAVF
jgi:hypothetical protein